MAENDEHVPAETLKIGAAQISEVYFDTEATLRKDCEYIRKAGEDDLDLIVFPEFHIPASPHWYRYDDDIPSYKEYYKKMYEGAIEVPGPAVDRLSAAARDAGVAVVMGVTEKEPDRSGSMYNTQFVIDRDGQFVGARRKIMPTGHERLFHGRGSGQDIKTFDTSIGQVGAMMCGEHYNQLASFAINAHGETVHAASWPAMAWYDSDRRDCGINVFSRYHSFAGNVPTASATGAVTQELADAAGLPEAWVGESGSSAIIGPEGQFLAGPKWGGEGIVSAEIDQDDRILSKSVADVLGHYNRFDIFTLEIDKSPHDPYTVTNQPAITEQGSNHAPETDHVPAREADETGNVPRDGPENGS